MLFSDVRVCSIWKTFIKLKDILPFLFSMKHCASSFLSFLFLHHLLFNFTLCNSTVLNLKSGLVPHYFSLLFLSLSFTLGFFSCHHLTSTAALWQCGSRPSNCRVRRCTRCRHFTANISPSRCDTTWPSGLRASPGMQ